MKVVILAGGYGTRISEESYLKPKPMVEIDEKPILWHIMKYYSTFGFHEFVICCGYKAYLIKEYFADYYIHTSDVTFDFTKDGQGSMEVHSNQSEPWKVTLVDTGKDVQTGGRVKRIQRYIGNETFMLTYGDGVSNVDLHSVLKLHSESKKTVTLTGVQLAGRFGLLDIENNTVTAFREKDIEEGGWINGGFMVCEPEIFQLIGGDDTNFERTTLPQLAVDGKLCVYKHFGFWKCMDTQRDKMNLEALWNDGKAAWKVWDK
ncbi:glucose-1-phosphate cytidylyltransferase [Clostridia bacterium]|nr:glucose-1-phosphate cytidylyltransferase [Clostridia bacterium]